MSSALIHRGPDEYGEYTDKTKSLYLAHRRLTIVDPTGGRQPMWDVSRRVCIVFNGEIYNHRLLRKQLLQLGYRFESRHSDTEVILNAYLAWGISCLKQFNGMWSFALYDKQNQIIYLSRDRFGEKPLYFSRTGNSSIVFSSELKSIRQHTHVEGTINDKALKKYFTYGYIPSPNSILKDVEKLAAGSYLRFDMSSGNDQIVKYFDFSIQPDDEHKNMSARETGEELISLLGSSVKQRLEADVPVGVFLSGGIDSSLITALACKNHGNDKVKTFTVGFREGSYDEARHAERVATLFETDQHTHYLDADNMREIASNIGSYLDEPMGDPSIVPTLLLCKETAKEVTVALSGDGADELLCGYPPFSVLPILRAIEHILPKGLIEFGNRLIQRIPSSSGYMSFEFKLKRAWRAMCYERAAWAPIWMSPLLPHELEEILSEPIEVEELYEEAISAWNAGEGVAPLDRLTKFYVDIYLQNNILTKTDRASMAFSLETRAPFLDNDVVNFISKLSYQQRMHHGTKKGILKYGAKDILPPDILGRPKHGFGVPVDSWFRNGEISVGLGQHYSAAWERKYDSALGSHQSGRRDERAYLWNYYLLCHWKNGLKTV